MKRFVILLLVVGLAACGADDPDIGDRAAPELAMKVVEIRSLASARQADAVAAKLGELRAAVEQFLADGELSQDAAKRILDSASTVEANLPLITTTTTTTAPPPPDEGKGNKKRDEEKDED